MDRVFIKPNEGRRVRLESGMLLPKDGLEVVRSTYVERRIKSEDAIIVPRPIEKKETKSSKKNPTGGDA